MSAMRIRGFTLRFTIVNYVYLRLSWIYSYREASLLKRLKMSQKTMPKPLKKDFHRHLDLRFLY